MYVLFPLCHHLPQGDKHSAKLVGQIICTKRVILYIYIYIYIYIYAVFGIYN